MRGDIHSFGWPAFLSQALMMNGHDALGYPYDHAARAAFQVTFVYMLFSVVALATKVRYPGTGALALILLLQVSLFEYVSRSQSRDAFRIIPLMLLATVLSGLSPQRLYRRLEPASLLPPLVLAAFSVTGHTLGWFVVPMIALAWVIWSVIGVGRCRNGLRVRDTIVRIRLLKVFLLLIAVGLGLLAGGGHNIRAYLATGSVRGINFQKSALYGTPVWEKVLERNADDLLGTTSAAERLALLAGRDEYRLAAPGLVAALFTLVLWLRFGREKRTASIPFIGLIVVANTLPMAGLLDAEGYRVSEGFVRNSRYALHFYPFAAACVAMLTMYGYYRMKELGNRWHRGVAMLTLTLLCAAASYSSYDAVANRWGERAGEGLILAKLEARLEPLQRVLHEMPAGERLLLDREEYNYYLHNRAVEMQSRLTWEIIQATSESEVQGTLDTSSIAAVALEEARIPGWWDQIPMFSFLSSPENALVIPSSRESGLRVYIVDESMVHRQKALDEATFRDAMKAALLHVDFSTIESEGSTECVISRTGEKASIEGVALLADGPSPESKALLVDETTRLTCPNVGIGLSQGSLSLWARLTDPGSSEISVLAGVNASRDLRIRYTGPKGRFVPFYNGVELGRSLVTITDDEWHHYVFTWEEGRQEFYIDGLHQLSGELPAAVSDTELFSVGWSGNRRGPHRWRGLLANLITFDRALSHDEVAALYRISLQRSSTDQDRAAAQDARSYSLLQ